MIFSPLFLDLSKKNCLILGGGIIATRKLLSLKDSGMIFTIISPEVTKEIESFAKDTKNITIIRDKYISQNLSKYYLIIIATNDKSTNKQALEDAKKSDILINTAEDSVNGNVLIPSVVKRDPIQIAISSGGASPILTRVIKNRLEYSIPFGFSALAKIMMQFRSKVKSKFKLVKERRIFWENFLDSPISEMVLSGHLDKANKMLEKDIENGAIENSGEVYLVGSGPGDPELLTFRALRLMQKADVVIYDRLVSDPIMNLLRKDSEKIYVGKERADHAMPQEEINDLLVRLAKDGKKVLRLKGGDPFIFGRGGEEIESLIDYKIPFQIVPGITAASGCSSYAGIPLTHRDFSQACIFVTGHLKDGSINLNWQMLAHPNQTLIFYLGMHGAKIICKELIKHGLNKETPAALITKGTTPEQKIYLGDLQTLPSIISNNEIKPPTLMIIGNVVKLHEKLQWFIPK